MPELPDVTVYVERVAQLTSNATLDRVRLASPFVLRTVTPTLRDVEGKRVKSTRRMGKRIVLCLADDLFVVVHLMVSGRFRWGDKGSKIPGKLGLAAFDFSTGTLLLTEASSKKRASIHVVRGEADLAAFDRGGLEVMTANKPAFVRAMTRINHTLKRALTDPTILSGIGNGYSDEILHAAKLSPMRLTSQMSDEEWTRLFDATQKTLKDWIERLRAESKDSLPEKVTAFRPEMAVHGRYGKPCPACGSKVQRITYADNETNYCATCQMDGKLLADRSLSRLLKDDWPKSLEELEEKRPALATLPAKPERSTKKR